MIRSPWHITGPREPVWRWLFYVLTGSLFNTKAWGYVTNILGGAVYVVDVDCVEAVRRLDAPMAWPPTVIFVDRGVAERLRPAVAPRGTSLRRLGDLWFLRPVTRRRECRCRLPR